MPNTEPDFKDYISLIVIKEANLGFMGDLCLWAGEWAEENGYDKPLVKNSREGGYELIAKPIN